VDETAPDDASAPGTGSVDDASALLDESALVAPALVAPALVGEFTRFGVSAADGDPAREDESAREDTATGDESAPADDRPYRPRIARGFGAGNVDGAVGRGGASYGIGAGTYPGDCAKSIGVCASDVRLSAGVRVPAVDVSRSVSSGRMSPDGGSCAG
jgi:hypothetical protein